MPHKFADAKTAKLVPTNIVIRLSDRCENARQFVLQVNGEIGLASRKNLAAKALIAACLLLPLSLASQAQTQTDMSVVAAQKAEQIKEKIVKQIRMLCSLYRDRSGLVSKLDETEELWKNFAQAHIDSIFPLDKNQDAQAQYGSVYSYCVATYQEELNSKRLLELQQWSVKNLSAPPANMNEATAQKNFDSADKDLNAAYVKVMHSEAKKTPGFIQKMRKAETAWIAFRDADAEAFELCEQSPVAKELKMAELTKARTKQLSKWVTGVQEGDTCAGTYPVH